MIKNNGWEKETKKIETEEMSNAQPTTIRTCHLSYHS